MIKMVITDLDDTLLRTNKTISRYTTNIINQVRGQGVKVIFATGRGSSTKTLVPYDLITFRLPGELYLNLSRDNLAMIMHKEVTKLNAVLEVANQFDISASEIVAFGDDINDKEMLINIGLGVSMRNSIDEIVMIADVICETNDDDGVAKWLDENIVVG